MPEATDIPAPPQGVVSPGGKALPDMQGAAPVDAPAIGAVSEVTFPGETLVVTGDKLDGACLRMWAEGTVFSVEPLRAAQNRMQAVVPTQVGEAPVPRSTMLVWPEKDATVGAPIRVNGATAWWAWPCRFRPGQDSTMRIFGKNLRLDGATPTVYLTGPDEKPVALTVKDGNPYHLEVEAPDRLAPGEYCLQAHNGTGGIYGWSEPVTVTVTEAVPATVAEFAVADFLPEGFRAGRENADPYIQQAIDRASQNGGGIVRLPAGVFQLRGPVVVPEGPAVTVRGAGMGDWERAAHTWKDGNATVLVLPAMGFRQGIYTDSRVIDLKADGARLADLSIVMYAAVPRPHTDAPFKVVHLTGRNQTVERCRIYTCQPGEQCIWCESPGASNLRILDCELYPAGGGAVHIVGSNFVPATDLGESTDFVQVRGCTVYGMFRGGRGAGADAFIAHGGNQLIIEENLVTSLDRAHAWLNSRTVLMYSHLQHDSYLANNRSLDVGVHPSAPGVDRNVSEQYLFHMRNAPKGGTLTVAAADRARDTVSQTLPVGDDLLGGWLVLITRGKGVGQWRRIVAATETGVFRLAKPWRIVPEPGALVVVQPFFHHHTVYGNTIDTAASDPNLFAPDHKSTGVYFYHTSVDNIVAGNTIRNVASGITFGQGFDTPTAWNLTRDNVMSRIRGNSGGTSEVPMFYCDHVREAFRPGITPVMWYSIANICRANRGEGADAIGSVGWRMFSRGKTYVTPDSEQGQMMPVIENNEFTRAERGFVIAPPANWALLRGNIFGTTDPTAQPVESVDSQQTYGNLIRHNVSARTGGR
jgi:hypothetical protein